VVDITIALDRNGTLSLQNQLRQGIVEAIYAGTLRPGTRLPSSRSLATRLGVSRNTVVLAYGDLTADGYLESRDRSGNFISHRSLDGKIVGRSLPQSNDSPITERMARIPVDGGARCPPQWRQYPYPFRDGLIDPALMPLQDWRRAVRQASCPRDAAQWAAGNGEFDDPLLIEELRSKVLPECGITARAEQVIVTDSVRQALQFLVTLLVQPGSLVRMEEPADPEVLATLSDRGAQVERYDPNQAGGLSRRCLLITSARSGIATGTPIKASAAAAVVARDGLVIELGTPSDTLEDGALRPSLYARMGSDRVIYIGCLSPAATCGPPLTFMVSNMSVITRVRELRRVSGALPHALPQRSWAYFLSLGHYAAALNRARGVLTARKTAMRDALNHYLHAEVDIQSVPGSSAYWVRCRGAWNAHVLAGQASSAGVLIEPAHFNELRTAFMLGVTAVPEQRIREGVAALSSLFRASTARREGWVERPEILSAAGIRRAVSGGTILYNTVYGQPCTIEVQRSGKLVGMAGYANDDPDLGRWWIENDRWFRQWDHWAYGEAEGFAVAVKGDRIYWYDDADQLVDAAIILRRVPRKVRARA
jgi:GntR family transcriptional regulator/MocR family aminotransferase